MDRSLPALAAAVALAAAPLPARADFYTIEGRFQCLDKPGAVCFDAVIPPASLLAEPAPRPAAEPHPTAAEVAPPAATARAPAPPVKAAVDPVLAIAARIERKEPADGDVATLRRAAEAGDTRALELLAWCLLRGIGAPRDAMAAYDLYGRAAAAGVPRAAENQRLVFERSLTSDERERLLEVAARAPRSPQALAAGAGLPATP